MSTRTPTRLELHRLKRRWTGGQGRPLALQELSIAEHAILSEAVMQEMLVKFWDYPTARTVVLDEWGISS